MKIQLNRLAGKALLALSVASLLTASSAWATVLWELNPSNLNQNVGSTSRTYTQPGNYSIVARGFDNDTVVGTDVAHELFYKSEGAGEHGLGLVGTPHNELQVNADGTPANYIQLDLTSILLQGFTNGQIEVASVQSGETFQLFGSNSIGVLGTQLGGTFSSSFDSKFVAIPNFGNFKFVSVASGAMDVLPVAFRADITPVPEMSALFPIVGLLAAVSSTQILRRRRMARMAVNS